MYKPKQVLSQQNFKWANTLLGFNTGPYTIGSHGCLITCLSMMTDITPDVMNTKLKEVVMSENPKVYGFKDGGFYVWGAFTKLFNIPEKLTLTPDRLTNLQMAEIKTALDEGRPVMCGIDSIPVTQAYDMHFVLLTDYNGEDFTIADPWTGTIRPLKDYLYAKKPAARDTIEHYVIYDVAVTPPCEKLLADKTDECRKAKEKYDKLAEYLYVVLDISGDSGDSKKIVTAVDQLNKDFSMSKDVIDSQNKAYEQEKLVWEATKDGLDKQILALTTDKVQLLKDVDALHASLTEANKGGGWDLIARGLIKIIKGGE